MCLCVYLCVYTYILKKEVSASKNGVTAIANYFPTDFSSCQWPLCAGEMVRRGR
jgi:hypothetical protein